MTMTLPLECRDKRLMVIVNVVVVIFVIGALCQVTIAEEEESAEAQTKLNETEFNLGEKKVSPPPEELKEVSGCGMMENKDIFKEGKASAMEVMKEFAKTDGERLTRKDFGALCKCLFRNGSEPYQLEEGMVDEMFRSFDWNKNDHICRDEFESCYNDWILKILKPSSVLVIVDVQNDFISGSLALKNAPAGEDGKCVISPINNMLDTIPFDKVFYTKDWHPKEHISFIDNVENYTLHKSSPIQDATKAKVLDTVIFSVGDDGHPIEQKLWPAHCVQNTSGADLDLDLKVVNNSQIVNKGLQPDVDSYSAFLDNDKKSMTLLKDYIDKVGAKDVYVCGLAYDFCVGGTALDALKLGFRTMVVEDATGKIDVGGAEKMRDNILSSGGLIIDTGEVKDMVEGVDRRPEMGLHLAKALHREKMQKITENDNKSK